VAFNEIYRDHHRKVYNFCLNYLRNEQDAEEAAQDVFVKVHQKIGGFKAGSQLSTWIYRIAVNVCHDIAKARTRKKRFGFMIALFHEETGEVRREAETFVHPGVELEHREAVERIFALIDRLPPNQKAAILLSRIEEKSQKEIAAILNVSEKAVESLLFRAKENLAKKLNAPE
jgi:RNA polymerase sigma-70 factor (ECF subfamily)